MGVDEFGLEVVEVGVVKSKPTLQCPVRDTALALEEIENLWVRQLSALRTHLQKGRR